MTAIPSFPVGLLGVAALLACGGCNTVAGFGRDVEAAGAALASAAEKVVGADSGTSDVGMSGFTAPRSPQAR
jgi:predicted small secreted protein